MVCHRLGMGCQKRTEGILKVFCPYCDAGFEVESFSGGRRFQCGGCGKKFRFAGGTSFKYGAFTSPVLPGMDRLVCPECGGNCDIARGTRHDSLTTCPACRTTFAVPKDAPPPPPEPVIEPAAGPEPSPEPPEPKLAPAIDAPLPAFEMKEGIGGDLNGLSPKVKWTLAALIAAAVLAIGGAAVLLIKAVSSLR